MALYRFKTFNSTYLFPQLSERNRFIYSLYGNYGGKAAHALWWWFRHSRLYRQLCKVQESDIEAYQQVTMLLGAGCTFGINTGTKGPDQKMSILGYDNESGKKFFAKLSLKERAKALSRNEINVYQALADTGMVPQLYDYKITDDYVFLKCECINGTHVHGQIDQRQVKDMLMTLKEKHYSDTTTWAPDLQTCFAHMDFCPWNMIDVDGTLHIIDWEMADEMPLGFDLFTYLLQTNFLTDGTKTGEEIIKANEAFISEYFGTGRQKWQKYLKAFLEWKIDFFSHGQNNPLLKKFKEALQQ